MTKTIFITGASAGLGKATAKLFQAKGWNVIATMRNPQKETELTSLDNITLLPLDITNPHAITTTVDQVMKKRQIDVVFNNAGYGLAGALETYTDEAIVEQVNTNLIGAIRVTKAFIPYFKSQGGGLFITTTSVFGFITCPVSSIYNATKWALEGWAESMYYELALFNIGIKTIAPGLISSNFVNGMTAFTNPDYDLLFEKMLRVFMEDKFLEASSPEVIAQVVLDAATDDRDQLRYLAGSDAIRLSQLRADLGNEGFRKYFSGLLKYDVV
jgi:NAD(P)-dependent dehydrogenase (short-subunit alcohol dehydrogenase family)